jgi:hypothetical protein
VWRGHSCPRRAVIKGEIELDFQINDETYFASLGEGEWQVFVETPTGARAIPVYDDGIDFEESPVLVEDKRRRNIVN